MKKIILNLFVFSFFISCFYSVEVQAQTISTSNNSTKIENRRKLIASHRKNILNKNKIRNNNIKMRKKISSSRNKYIYGNNPKVVLTRAKVNPTLSARVVQLRKEGKEVQVINDYSN